MCNSGNMNIFISDLIQFIELAFYLVDVSSLRQHPNVDRATLKGNREVKQNFLTNVPAAESHPNFFGISPYWRNLFLTGFATSRRLEGFA